MNLKPGGESHVGSLCMSLSTRKGIVNKGELVRGRGKVKWLQEWLCILQLVRGLSDIKSEPDLGLTYETVQVSPSVRATQEPHLQYV